MNLLENCFDFNESWSLLLVKLTLSINRTDFRTKKKNDRHAWFLKKLFTGPGSCLLPFLPGVGLLLLFLLLVLTLLLPGQLVLSF